MPIMTRRISQVGKNNWLKRPVGQHMLKPNNFGRIARQQL